MVLTGVESAIESCTFGRFLYHFTVTLAYLSYLFSDSYVFLNNRLWFEFRNYPVICLIRFIHFTFFCLINQFVIKCLNL
jgi:hypothetical protein